MITFSFSYIGMRFPKFYQKEEFSSVWSIRLPEKKRVDTFPASALLLVRLMVVLALLQ